MTMPEARPGTVAPPIVDNGSMDNHSSDHKFKSSLLILVLLGLAAVAAGYFLYFQEPRQDQLATELTAQAITHQDHPKAPEHKLQGTLSEEEKHTLSVARSWSEFQNPLDESSLQMDALASLRGLHIPSVQPTPVETRSTGRIKEENITSVQATPALSATTQTTAADTPKSEIPSAKNDQTSVAGKPSPGDLPMAQTETKEADSEAAATADKVISQLNIQYLSPESLSTPKSKNVKAKSGKVWVANVLSTQDPDKLRETFDVLMKEKVVVYAYETEVQNEKWFRIRIGFFNSQAEAQAVGREMAKKYGLTEPWIVRPGPQELSKYYNR